MNLNLIKKEGFYTFLFKNNKMKKSVFLYFTTVESLTPLADSTYTK